MYEWQDTIPRTKMTLLGAAQTVGAVSVGAIVGQAFTIVRLRGTYTVHMDTGAIGDGQLVGLGLAVVSEDAFTVGGAGSMPSPIDDAGFPFIWHRLFMLQASTATESDDSFTANERGEIDSKAMRKMKPGQVLAFIWDGIILAGSPTTDGSAAVRILGLL